MKARIHWEYDDGTEDSIVIAGDDLEELHKQAQREVDKRGGKNPWSEELES